MSKNTGVTKATAAALAVNGRLVNPGAEFGPDRPAGATDFNDLMQYRGLEAVKKAVDGAVSATALIKTDVTHVTDVTPNEHGAESVTPAVTGGVTDVTKDANPAIPDANHRPRFIVFDDWARGLDGEKMRPGVWYFSKKEGKDDKPPTLFQERICSPVHIDAVTFDGHLDDFGRRLRFINTNQRWNEFAMPMALLSGGGDELRAILLAKGVDIEPSTRGILFAKYLQSPPPARRVRCALQTGWHDGCFVLPSVVIGDNAENVIFQCAEVANDEYTQAGTLEGWRAGIAARAVGNIHLLVAVSSSFTGPLLKLCHQESGGLHFVGESSTGKTTLLEAACATWGGPRYKRSWRTTSNGLEGAAVQSNDCLLALDEISECDPRDIDAIAYALSNGTGKQRASRTGSARKVASWRVFVLSSGERTIETAMLAGGYRAKAGQKVRLLDIQAARQFGAWDNLHGMGTGNVFSDAIKDVAATHYGQAGRAFLERLTRDKRDFGALLEKFKALPHFSAPNGEGQEKRVAARFALLAMAGELATEYGLTGWPEDSATHAAAEVFRLWRAARGHGNDERKQILERVADFIALHSDSRFTDAERPPTTHDVKTINRAGWWRDDPITGRQYLFNSPGLHEALKGFDFKRALDTLQEAGALPPGKGERAKTHRINGHPVKLYTIYAEKLGGDHGA